MRQMILRAAGRTNLLPIFAALIAFFVAKGPRWSQDVGQYGVVRERMFSHDGRQLFTIHLPLSDSNIDRRKAYTLARWDISADRMIGTCELFTVRGLTDQRTYRFSLLPHSNRILAVETDGSHRRLAYRYSIHDPENGACVHGPASLAGYTRSSYWSNDRRWYVTEPATQELMAVAADTNQPLLHLKPQRKPSNPLMLFPFACEFSRDGRSFVVLWSLSEEKTLEVVDGCLLCLYDLPSGRLLDERLLGLPAEDPSDSTENSAADRWRAFFAADSITWRESRAFPQSSRRSFATMDASGRPVDPRLHRSMAALPSRWSDQQTKDSNPVLTDAQPPGFILRYNVAVRPEVTLLEKWLMPAARWLGFDRLRLLPEVALRARVFDSWNGRLVWELPDSGCLWLLPPDGRHAAPVDESTGVELYSSEQTPPWLAALAAGMATLSALGFVRTLRRESR